MKNKRIIRITLVALVIILLVALFFLPRINRNEDEGKIKIIATNFPSYDIARALADELDISVKMLLKPGAELHDYDPTPQDIAAINSADVFIFIGGESETWVDKITFNEKTLVIKLINSVDLKQESPDAEEYDEHIWTSPANYLNMLSYTRALLARQFPEYDHQLSTNLSIYGEDIKRYDQLFRTTKLIQPIVIADRFPFRYFVDEYHLQYSAAFPGCAEQTEASTETIAELITTVKNQKLPYIYALDLSNSKIARTIADATGAEIRTLYSGHNISQDDFSAGVDMTVIYQRNLEALQETK